MRLIIWRSCSLLAFLFFAMGWVVGVAHGQSVTAEKWDQIAQTYRLQIVTENPQFPIKTTYGAIDGKAADRKSLDNYRKLFFGEFTLYPPDLIRRTHLQSIVLCRELSFAQQRRNAIPDYEHNTLYLDVERGAYNTNYLRTVLHHEFFHIIDFCDDGEVYTDKRWATLNSSGFMYGRGGKNAQGMELTSILTDAFPGFLNHYSTTGVEEDKAEVFANLIVQNAYVKKRAEKDPVLRNKVARMQELLRRFCPTVNEAFWKKAGAYKRSDTPATLP